MKNTGIARFSAGLAILVISSFLFSCTPGQAGQYFGKTAAPADNVLRYVSGSEPQSIDPAIPTGQPEARLIMALYEGLVEYHPKTMRPLPAIAERWEVNTDSTAYIFHIRDNATFSNGEPITAGDFVYTMRRALSPELAARNAKMAYYIKYAEGYNAAKAFVKRSDGSYVLKQDVDPKKEKESLIHEHDGFGADTEFNQFINAPERWIIPGDEKSRDKFFDENPNLKPFIENAEFVPVEAEHLGLEAIDDHTLRIKLYQPAPFFVDMLGHQFFKIVHPETVEKYGDQWTKPANIVTSGAFRLKEHYPYDRIIVEKDPKYWDADTVKLDRIEFYPMEEATTMMNLYKTGSVDALYNNVPPAAWVDTVRTFKDEYLGFPAAAIEYYTINVTRPPMDNLKVRQAFSLAVDRDALAKFRRTTTPLVEFMPEGIFPRYEEARTRVYEKELAKIGSNMDEWKNGRKFDPEKARKLLGEAGFPVQGDQGNYSVPSFPIQDVEILYNTSESNKAIAEFLQAQWRQNLGLTVPLKNMEWMTFLSVRNVLDYKGMGRAGWVADYMDPFSFLYLFYGQKNESATGWSDSRYDQMVNRANREMDIDKRFQMLAEAEFYMMQHVPIIPLQTQSTNWIKKPYVKGMYPNPGTMHPWKFVYIERDESKWDRNVSTIMDE